MRSRDLRQVLVFTRTKHMAARLAAWLDRVGVDSTAIHGDRSQSDREKALEQFKSGEVRVLVATDVAARGLDIEGLPQVVNFELPYHAQDYVHRIGRTGRAGMTGHAISLVSLEEEDQLKSVNRLLKKDLPLRQVRGFELDPRAVAPPRAPRGAAPARTGRPRSASTGTREPRRRPLSRRDVSPPGPMAHHPVLATPGDLIAPSPGWALPGLCLGELPDPDGPLQVVARLQQVATQLDLLRTQVDQQQPGALQHLRLRPPGGEQGAQV